METGINQLSLYDQEGRILCERLIFINHGDRQLTISKKQNKASYSPFEKIDMEFEISDGKGEPVETNFSLSVRDAGTTTLTAYNDNILTNLLLSSELKGYVENPSYYFESEDEQHKADLDLLLLTQGWRRYVWERMAGIENFKLNHPAEKGILIDGMVKTFTRSKKKPDVDVSIILQNDSLGILHETAKTDENGRFSVYTKDIRGDWDIVIQMKEKNKKKDYQAMLNRLFGPKPLSYRGYETRLRTEQEEKADVKKLPEEKPEADTTSLLMSEKDHRLPQATVKAKKKDESLPKMNITYNVGKEIDRILDEGDYVGNNLIEFLLKTNRNFSTHYVEGVEFYSYINQPAVFQVNGKSFPIYSYWENNPVHNLFLNEVEKIEFKDISITKNMTGNNSEVIRELRKRLSSVRNNIFAGLPIPEIDKQKFIAETEILKELLRIYESGFVSINIKTFPDGKFRAERKGIRHTQLQGYSCAKEFYSPKYNYQVYPDEQDFRRTLYWNPDIKTDKEGKASVGFWNNSTSKKLLVDAEGLTSEGMLATNEFN